MLTFVSSSDIGKNLIQFIWFARCLVRLIALLKIKLSEILPTLTPPPSPPFLKFQQKLMFHFRVCRLFADRKCHDQLLLCVVD